MNKLSRIWKQKAKRMRQTVISVAKILAIMAYGRWELQYKGGMGSQKMRTKWEREINCADEVKPAT